MTENIIKRTKSLSPLSLKVIDAYLTVDDNNVYMVKKDENGLEYKSLVEKDQDLYSLLTNKDDDYSANIHSFHTYVSSKCNLNCKYCYEKYGTAKEAEREEINAVLDKYKNCSIVMMGKEPTCREDLCDLIARAGKRTCLVTNGIKLGDLAYLKKLKSTGLKTVLFSFNGLKDEIYRKMNGADLVDAKLKALKNLEGEKINTILSVSLERGVNDDQILPLVSFCFERRSFIFELRIRTMTSFVKDLGTEQIYMSELITMFADALRVSKTDIMREFCFMQEFIQKFKWLLPKAFQDKYTSKLCSFTFHIKKGKGNKYSSPGYRINLDRIKGSMFKSPYLLYYLVKAYGLSLLIETAFNVLKLPRLIIRKKILNITLKCWPNLYNVDLKEMDKCTSVYYRNGTMEKFCLANIKNAAREERLH